MRRVLALGCFVQGAYLYWECARTGRMAALYAGMASEAGMLVLLFFTTWTDLKGVVLAVKGLATGNAGGEAGGQSVDVCPEGRPDLGK
jgi:hypothetical protein